ncbi:MAG TPA: TolC family protein [bacterium]|nr:TolC family protein [bacterium]
MNHIRHAGLIVFLVFLCVGSRAEEFIAFDFLKEEAKKNNPEIKASRAGYESLKQRAVEQRILDKTTVGMENTADDTMFFFRQMLPFPGKLSLRGRMAEYEAEAAKEKWRSELLEVTAELKKNYWKYWLNDSMIAIYLENTDLMKRFVSIAETRYATGKSSQLDLLKAKTELKELEARLLLLVQEKVSLQAEINRLCNRPSGAILGKPVTPLTEKREYSYEEWEKMALENRPEMRVANILYLKSQKGLSLARREWYPDFMAEVRKPGEENPVYMVEMTLPIFFNKQAAAVKMARSESKAEHEMVEALGRDTEEKVKSFFTGYETRLKTALLYEKDILPYAKQILEVTESGYRTGKNDFLDLLDSQRKYLVYMLDFYMNKVESEIYLAELERTAGIEEK